MRDFARDLPGIGHNGGPPIDEGRGFRLHCWRNAQKELWQTPPREIVLRRARLAAACGLTYLEYTREILLEGRYLFPGTDDARISEIKAARR